MTEQIERGRIPDIVHGSPVAREGYGRVTPAVAEELRAIVGARGVLSDPADLATYAYDGTFLESPPDCVVLPESTAHVAAIMRLATAHRIPIVSRGAGSGLAGGTVPLAGGIVLSMVRMNRILELDTVNMCARVQPGVITGDLQKVVAAEGLLYPPDPASLRQSTIGGNVGMCAGGPKGLKYGVTKDFVLGLEAVLADGRVLRSGGKMIKNVTGYNLTQLFVGSEGTLGVVTEVILRLVPRPRASRTALAVFPRIDDAARIVTIILGAGITPATIELMDRASIRAVEDFKPFGLPTDAEAVLLIEVDGDESSVQANVREVGRLCEANGASEVRVATTAAESQTLWEARRAVSPSITRIRPTKLGEDISVPRSQIPAAVRAVQRIAERYNLPIPLYGHISDGNLHPNILFDRHDAAEVERVNAAAGEIFAATVALDGTLTGEHGIGSLKKEYLASALDPVALEMMRAIKAAFDPLNLLNPGKVFPSETAHQSPITRRSAPFVMDMVQ